MPGNGVPVVSVVIPTYKHSDQLIRLLRSLDKQEGLPSYEIVVVDDCSPDDTEEVVKAWCAEPADCDKRYVKMPQNGGPAKARNEGARQARGRYVAFTDTDCVADPHWLARLVARMDEGNKVIGVGGAVQPYNPDGLIARYFTEYQILQPHPFMIYLVSSNCCLLRELVLEVGGFDEEIPCPGGEDIGLGIQLWKRGWKFAFAPGAVILHDYRESWRDYCNTWWRYGYGCGYVCRKHLGEQEPPSASNPPAPETGWIPNPIHVTTLPFGKIYHETRHAFAVGVKKFRSLRVGIGLVVLRLAQFYIHRRGWRKGVQERIRDEAQLAE